MWSEHMWNSWNWDTTSHGTGTGTRPSETHLHTRVCIFVFSIAHGFTCFRARSDYCSHSAVIFLYIPLHRSQKFDSASYKKKSPILFWHIMIPPALITWRFTTNLTRALLLVSRLNQPESRWFLLNHQISSTYTYIYIHTYICTCSMSLYVYVFLFYAYIMHIYTHTYI